ncbi:MAG: class I SAM-dependent methyltransferase [Cytophagales bacterium]|nr:class I SAM-dependent methyltransferase [Cytophagales bacterium]
MKEKIKNIYRFLSPKFQNLFLEYKVDLVPRYGFGKPPHDLLFNIVTKNRSHYSNYLNHFIKFKETFIAIKTCDKETNQINPCWNNGYLPGLDIISIYGLIHLFKPKLFVEVGSGTSTKVAYKSIKDNKLQTRIISVDPFPRNSIDQLCYKTIRQPFEQTDFSFIYELQENDILFIDNSHRALPNSDVTVFFLEVLPKLNKGVIVHLHDIYLPYDYPQFMADRFYSEQYLLACYLLANEEKFEIILPNYFISQDSKLNKILEPVWEHENLAKVEKHGGSFWFKIKYN